MRGISCESQVLLRLLEDGEWHPFEETYDRLLGAVAPGKALRRYEQIEAARVKQHGPRKGARLSEEEQIASGRRSIANDTVNSMRKRHVELVWAEAGRMLRRRETPLPVSDPYRVPPPPPVDPPATGQSTPGVIRHDDDGGREHRYPPPAVVPDVAFFSESQVRQLLREVTAEVVDAALDRFQRGMRGFLLGRFAELDRLLYRDAGPQQPLERAHPHDRAGTPRRNR